MKVYGLSLDDVASLKKFQTDQGLNFPLLSDPDASAASKYGVLNPRGYAERVTFVLDEYGVVVHVDESVDVSQHGSDLVAKVRSLR